MSATFFALAGILVAMIDYEMHYTYNQSDEIDPRKVHLVKRSPLRIAELILTVFAGISILLRHVLKTKWHIQMRLVEKHEEERKQQHNGMKKYRILFYQNERLESKHTSSWFKPMMELLVVSV